MRIKAASKPLNSKRATGVPADAEMSKAVSSFMVSRALWPRELNPS
ncbi:MAG TPA: hypothetical protein VF779_19765 [Pyrinomonadaceae bacterium]